MRDDDATSTPPEPPPGEPERRRPTLWIALRRTLHALDAAFSSGGLDAAAEELGRLAGRCASATSS